MVALTVGRTENVQAFWVGSDKWLFHSSEIKVDERRFVTFPNCFLPSIVSKSVTKNMGHGACKRCDEVKTPFLFWPVVVPITLVFI